MVDWDRGSYEDTASELAPAAEHLVELAAIQPGERVLDLGTGTGNAALLAARAGAHVTAADPSPRLLGVAQERLAAEGHEGEFAVAKAEALPFADAAFDVVVSVFAVIFTEQPERAAGEIVRVLAPGGRALIATWEPAGAMHEALGVMGAAAGKATGTTRPRFGWGEPATVTDLFARAGAAVQTERAQLRFEGPSADAYLERFESRHPAGILFRDVLTRAGGYDEARGQALAALDRHNEADSGLRLTSGYFVFTIRAS
jgi:SAM-dependent methyltransferase